MDRLRLANTTMPTRPDKTDPGATYQFTVIRKRLSERPETLDFALGRRPEAPPEWVAGFIAERAPLALQRHDRRELEALDEAVGRMLERVYGIRHEVSVVATAGGRGAMSVLAATAISPGDAVLMWPKARGGRDLSVVQSWRVRRANPRRCLRPRYMP